MTVLESIKQALEGAAKHNSDDSQAPSAVLWTDEESLWLPALPQLRSTINLITLGEFNEDLKQGPDSYIRYQLGKEQDSTLVIYLPGINRAAFRSVSDLPKQARHLLGLQYLCQFWTQKSHKDWTPSAFLLSDNGGLSLDVAQDSDTKTSLQLALPEVLECAITKLQDKKLEATDFRSLSTPDPIKELLLWIDSPEQMDSWPRARQSNFKIFCKSDYGFDPISDGPITAAQSLAGRQGNWDRIWQRFCEAPSRYPGLISRLEKVSPETDDLFMDKSSWPLLNNKAEDELCDALTKLNQLPQNQACEQISRLHVTHASRSEWIWASLGKSPLALAIQALSKIAELSQKNIYHDSWDELSDYYTTTGHLIDTAMLQALNQANGSSSSAAIHNALEAIYTPWLESLAQHVQSIDKLYPVLTKEQHRKLELKPGTCFLFVDGLRYDIAVQLQARLEKLTSSTLRPEWSALPSVTSTAKPAWYPLSDLVYGATANADFSPSNVDGKELTTQRFRKLLTQLDMDVLPKSETGNPSRVAWTECADIDSLGHKEGWKLAKHVDTQIEIILERVSELLDAGWKNIEILTDHGWLLAPKGLEREELPAHLTDSKWGRSALPQPDARHNLKSVPWTWSSTQDVVIPSGARSFRKCEYAHGGLSLQECCIPRITLVNKGSKASQSQSPISVEKCNWLGLRYKATFTNAAGLVCDIRTKPNSPETSLLSKPIQGDSHLVKENNTVSLLIEDDANEGIAAVFIIATHEGEVIFKQPITISE